MGMFDECRLFLMLFIPKFAREVKINGLLSFLKVCIVPIYSVFSGKKINPYSPFH